MKVSVRDAAIAASEHFMSLRDVIGIPSPVKNIRLEETELSEDDRFWFITLGFDELAEDPIIPGLGSNKIQRKYRTFKVDAETGEVKSMKIRTI